MQNLYASEIIELLKYKKELLHEMLLLTEKQSQAIKTDYADEEDDDDDDATEELDKLLGEKDSIIKKINDIDLKLKDSILEEQGQDKELLAMSVEIKEVLNKIRILDDKNNKELSGVITEIGSHLKEIRESRRAMNKYGDSDPYHAFAAQGGTLFIDQDS